MANRDSRTDLIALKKKIDEAIALLDTELPPDRADRARKSLTDVSASIRDLTSVPVQAEASPIHIGKACDVLTLHLKPHPKESVESIEQATGVRRDLIVRILASLNKDSNLESLEYGISRALALFDGDLPPGKRGAKALLTAALALSRNLKTALMAHPSDAPAKPSEGPVIDVDDVCRVLELWEQAYGGDEALERLTGVHRTLIGRLRSAQVFWAKLEGWGDLR